jgi:hypothetical protein
MFAKIKSLLKRIVGVDLLRGRVDVLHGRVEELKMLTAKIFINQMKTHGHYENIHDVEFKVFSQFGDDGIIQYLIHQLGISTEVFIEFGVQDYFESNTRFLLLNNNWRGLVMDCSGEHIERIKQQDFYWRHELTAVQCWVERDNINDVIRDHGFAGPLGLLHVDIDGNDYWVWESLNVVEPDIVIMEYNSVFGDRRAITIPYDRAFYRTKAHYSNLYWGASLKALCLLGEKKGYAFVGANSNGNNAYFVKRSRLGKIKPMSVREGYVRSKYRESRDEASRLTFVTGDSRLKMIERMPVYDVETGRVIIIGELE